MSAIQAGEARRVLRAAARHYLRTNAYARLREHDRAMPRWAFASVIGVLATTRLLSVVTMLVAWMGWLADPRYWATGAKVVAEHTTPFHGHPNLFGWRWGFQPLVAMHNVTGALLFLVCLIPLAATKGSPLHVRFGRAFVLFWLVHLFDGLVNSAQILVSRGFEPTRYLDATKQGFSLYLYIQFAFISAVVIDFLAHGLAAIHYKNRTPHPAMRALMLGLPISSMLMGVAMTVWGIARLASSAPPATPSTTEFAVIFIAQVPAYLYLLGKNVAYWLRPSPRAWLHGWVTEHQRNLMFCVQVTLYTGFANFTMKFAPYLTAVLFISIDVGFIAWLLIKERSIRRSVLGARMAFALVSSMRGRDKPIQAGALPAADVRWIMKTFDIDGSGTLDAAEVRALLRSHGIDLADEETARVLAMLDRDGSGVIDRAELGEFLASWLAVAPTYDDDLALAFRALDTNGDGRLDAHELRAMLAGKDPGALSGVEVDEVLERMRTDSGGAVAYEDFAEAVESKRRGWKNPWLTTAKGKAGARIHAETAKILARSRPDSGAT